VPALVAGIHAVARRLAFKTINYLLVKQARENRQPIDLTAAWMAETSPAMTARARGPANQRAAMM